MESIKWDPPVIRINYLKKLCGIRVKMSFNENIAGRLWHSFIQRRGEIKNILTNELFSVAVYPEGFFSSIPDPDRHFDKWAAIETGDFDDVPAGMESLVIAEGEYVTTTFRGLSSDNEVFMYLISEWIPQNGYRVDDRPHFEILGEKYKNNDPHSEEEIWIPVRKY